MFKHFFSKLNSNNHIENQEPEVLNYTSSYDELFNAISLRKESANLLNETNSDNSNVNNRTISIPQDIEILEQDNFLQIVGNSKDLQGISDKIQSMEYLAPGDQFLFGDWRFLVTDGSVMSSQEEKFIALPPDEWLMMGCKFNDAISGYDLNPYTFYTSPFGNYTLPYGIEILVTDLLEGNEVED